MIMKATRVLFMASTFLIVLARSAAGVRDAGIDADIGEHSVIPLQELQPDERAKNNSSFSDLTALGVQAGAHFVSMHSRPAGTRRSTQVQAEASSKEQDRDAPVNLGFFDDGTCTADTNGYRVGCTSSCSCAWFEQCYPKLANVAGHLPVSIGDPSSHVDIGVCNTAMAFLGIISVMLFASVLGLVVVMRIFFQWRERLNDLSCRRHQAAPLSFQWQEPRVKEEDPSEDANSGASGPVKAGGSRM